MGDTGHRRRPVDRGHYELNWLCDPTGKPDSHRYGRAPRRVIFFLLGIVLIVVSIWSLVPEIK